MEQWKQDRLIDILDTLIDYRGKTPNKVERGIPLITAKIVKNGRIETPTEFLPAEEYRLDGQRVSAGGRCCPYYRSSIR